MPSTCRTSTHTAIAPLLVGLAALPACGDVTLNPPPTCLDEVVQAARVAVDPGVFGQNLDVPVGEEVLVDLSWNGTATPDLTCTLRDAETGAALAEIGVIPVATAEELARLMGTDTEVAAGALTNTQHAYYSFTASAEGLVLCEGSVQNGGREASGCAETAAGITAWPVECGATTALDYLDLLWLGQPYLIEPTCTSSTQLAGLEYPPMEPEVSVENAAWDGTHLTASAEGDVAVTVRCGTPALPGVSCETARSLVAVQEPQFSCWWQEEALSIASITDPSCHVGMDTDLPLAVEYRLLDVATGAVLASGTEPIEPSEAITLPVSAAAFQAGVGSTLSLEAALLVDGLPAKQIDAGVEIGPVVPTAAWVTAIGPSYGRVLGGCLVGLEDHWEITHVLLLDRSDRGDGGVLEQRAGAQTSYELSLQSGMIQLVLRAYLHNGQAQDTHVTTVTLSAIEPSYDVYELRWVASTRGVFLLVDGVVEDSFTGEFPVFDLDATHHSVIFDTPYTGIGLYYISAADELEEPPKSTWCDPAEVRTDVPVFCMDFSTLDPGTELLSSGEDFEPGSACSAYVGWESYFRVTRP